MAKRILKFSLSSYWRVSSGKGADAMADVMVLRDGDGLPIIPGRAVKGLLREAMLGATWSETVKPEKVIRWFGSSLPGQADGLIDGDQQEQRLEAARYETREAELWFGSARLPETWNHWLRQGTQATDSGPDKQDILGALFGFQSSTAIGDDGVAIRHTLRVAEVAVPLELRAEVHGPDDDISWVQDIKACLPLLRALGSRRNRGLGRVDVTMEDAK